MKKAAYLSLLLPIIAKYRQRSYEFWLPYLSGEPITSEFVTDDGTECQVEINAFWDDKPDGDILVVFSIDDGGWRAFIPVTDSFIIALDGMFVGE
jgi:hypothetical protein